VYYFTVGKLKCLFPVIFSVSQTFSSHVLQPNRKENIISFYGNHSSAFTLKTQYFFSIFCLHVIVILRINCVLLNALNLLDFAVEILSFVNKIFLFKHLN